MSEIWTIKKVLDWTSNHFTNKNISEPRLSAELLLAHLLKCKRLDLYLKFDQILTRNELTVYRDYINQRLNHKPVQYITGSLEFMGLAFKVTPQVFIPRPETEILVETIISGLKSVQKKRVRILDIGTGTGVIAISIAHFIHNSSVVGIDINENAITLAQENAKKLQVKSCEFTIADATKLELDKFGKFNLIVTNPPYIGEQEKNSLHDQVKYFEPSEALFSGKDGLDFYKLSLPYVRKLLEDDGSLYSEIGYDQRDKICNLLQLNGFKNISFIRDYQRIDRIVRAEL